MPLKEKEFKRCKKKDKGAQRALFDNYKSRVMGVCRRYSSCVEEAEDILQESFIKIFQNIDKVRQFEFLDRWIITTTVNTAINYYYKNRRHQGHLGYEDVVEFDDEDVSILDELSNEQLIVLINQLPDGYRLVFNLYVIEGYKHTEIAEMLSISENTSKSQLSRGKTMLREKLKSLGIRKYEKYG